jgi:thiosulfate reductase cytochrome b subunit
MASATKKRRAQPFLIRLTHWLNAPLLVLMAGSGLQILAAYPVLGPRGAPYRWYALQGWAPQWPRIGGWLAGGRAWHFAIAWFLVANGLAYLLYVFASGEWRRRFFWPPRDAQNAVETAAYYLRIHKDPPKSGLYNGLQRAAYTGAIVLGVVEVLSGLSIYKPVQLWWLAAIFGGYDGARAVHLFGLAFLALFTVGHIGMVLAHPRSLVEMVSGGKKE